MVLRATGRLAIAIAMGLGGDFPREVFLAMSDSDEEGTREYNRYLAHKRLNDGARTTSETF